MNFPFGPIKGYYTVLYCTVLYCTVLYCTVLYCTVLYCTVLYCTVLYCTVLCTGQADPPAVTVPADVLDDPEPDASGADPGRGHDETQLLRVQHTEGRTTPPGGAEGGHREARCVADGARLQRGPGGVLRRV